MGTTKYIVIAVLVISFLTFIIFFGRLPRLRNTPIGWSYRAIWIHIPSILRTVDRKLTHGRIYAWIAKQASYLWNDRHPLVLLFFMLLLGISEFMFLPPAWPLLSTAQKVKGSLAVILPWIFFYLSAASDPGYISQFNHHDQMALYPYDFSIFYPGQTCRTCYFLKPARSKHCSICKRCISKFDHHCIFINNCVGYRNHHFFILLISTTALLTVYATYVGLSLLSASIQKELPIWTFYGKGYTWTQYGNILAWAFNKHLRIGAITLLCLLSSPLVLGLLVYHLYLIWAGTTTNETLKWSDLRSDMADGYAFQRSLPIDRQKNERYESLSVQWPCESEHIITRSYDGRPPNPIIIGIGEWKRVWKLDDIRNLYDLGFMKNLQDIFWPRCPNRRVDHMKTSCSLPTLDSNLTKRDVPINLK